MVAAAANALVGKPEFDAASIDAGDGKEVKALGALAQRISEKCPSWALLTETTTLGKEDGGRKSWPAKEKAKRLLKQEDGMLILQPTAKDASNTRIAAADAGAGLSHDSMEPAAWKLCEESLAASAGKPETYVGIGEIRRLAKQRVKSPLLKRSRSMRGRKSRGKKQRQE